MVAEDGFQGVGFRHIARQGRRAVRRDMVHVFRRQAGIAQGLGDGCRLAAGVRRGDMGSVRPCAITANCGKNASPAGLGRLAALHDEEHTAFAEQHAVTLVTKGPAFGVGTRRQQPESLPGAIDPVAYRRFRASGKHAVAAARTNGQHRLAHRMGRRRTGHGVGEARATTAQSHRNLRRRRIDHGLDQGRPLGLVPFQQIDGRFFLGDQAATAAADIDAGIGKVGLVEPG